MEREHSLKRRPESQQASQQDYRNSRTEKSSFALMRNNNSRHQRVRSACKSPQTVLERINQFQNEKQNGTNERIVKLRQKLYPNLFDKINKNKNTITIREFSLDKGIDSSHIKSEISIQSIVSLSPDKIKINQDNQKLFTGKKLLCETQNKMDEVDKTIKDLRLNKTRNSQLSRSSLNNSHRNLIAISSRSRVKVTPMRKAITPKRNLLQVAAQFQANSKRNRTLCDQDLQSSYMQGMNDSNDSIRLNNDIQNITRVQKNKKTRQNSAMSINSGNSYYSSPLKGQKFNRRSINNQSRPLVSQSKYGSAQKGPTIRLSSNITGKTTQIQDQSNSQSLSHSPIKGFRISSAAHRRPVNSQLKKSQIKHYTSILNTTQNSKREANKHLNFTTASAIRTSISVMDDSNNYQLSQDDHSIRPNRDGEVNQSIGAQSSKSHKPRVANRLNKALGSMFYKITKTDEKTVLVDNLHLDSVTEAQNKRRFEKIEKDRSQADPKRIRMSKMVKDFFKLEQQEQLEKLLQDQIEERKAQATLKEQLQKISALQIQTKMKPQNLTIGQQNNGINVRRSTILKSSLKKNNLQQDTNINPAAKATLPKALIQSVSAYPSPKFAEITTVIPAKQDVQQTIEKSEKSQKRQMSIIPNRRMSVISKIQPKIAFNEKVQNAGESQCKGRKKVIQQYKNSKLTGQQFFMSWMTKKLKKETRERVQQIYENKHQTNTNEVYKDQLKKGPKKEIQNERFHRIPNLNASDSMPALYGHSRPQTTVSGRLQDEELGSLLQFKVPRHCRNHSAMSHNSAPDQDILFNYTEIGEGTKNELENNSVIGGTAKYRQSSGLEKKAAAASLSDNENGDDKEWLHADKGLKMGTKIQRRKTQIVWSNSKSQSMHESIATREANQKFLRKPTVRLPKKRNELINDDDKLRLPVFDESQTKELFNARCADLQIQAKEKQFKKFIEQCNEKCVNRKVNLTNMFLGQITAGLLAHWLVAGLIDVSHLYLGQNNLGDLGIERLAPAIAINKQIIVLDLSQNQFTPKCANSILQFMCQNESIIDLNLGSISGSMRNRLGKDGGQAVAISMGLNKTVVQFLHLRSVTIGNEEIEILAESLQSNPLIQELDLSHNRIEGARGGQAIANIISRRLGDNAEEVSFINLSHNNLRDLGFSAITNELLQPDSQLETLNVGHNGIEDLRLSVNLEPPCDLKYSVSHLILDGNNLFNSTAQKKLACLLQAGTPLISVSMKNCQIGNEGLIVTFEALETLKRLQSIDYSSNNIFSQGLIGIAPIIGKHPKSIIKKIQFVDNKIENSGFRRLLRAIEKNSTQIGELNFSQNALTNEAAIYLTHWLKNLRSKDVEHSLNMVQCDLQLNFVIYKYLMDVETELNINRKFMLDNKNREIETEVKIMKAGEIELRRCRRKQRRHVVEQKEVDDNLRFFQNESQMFQEKTENELQYKSIQLEQLYEHQKKVDTKISLNSIKFAKSTIQARHDDFLIAKVQFEQKTEDTRFEMMGIRNQLKEMEQKIQELANVPEHEKQMKYVPTLKKLLKAADKERDLAEREFKKVQKDLANYQNK